MKKKIAAIAVAAAATAAAPAQAHVTLQPEEAPAGGFTRLDVRVPNERDEAGTTKVQVQFPPGFLFASVEPREGWTTEVKRRKLDEPVEAFGEKQTDEVDTITFTAKKGFRIAPGEFLDFGLSVGLPDKPGEKLTFKALQTYEGGEVVRWIGPADADEPAPQVTLLAAEEEGHGGGSGGEHGESGGGAEQTSDTAAAQPAAAADEGDDGGDGASTGLVVVALILGALGLLAGVAGLATARRARGATA
jgi:uncharacterized protein YcnI